MPTVSIAFDKLRIAQFAFKQNIHPEQFMPPSEGVLHVDENRFVLFPIRYPTVRTSIYICPIHADETKLWQAYKDAQKLFWTTEEIDFSGDLSDWNKSLNSGERALLSVVLAFFASSDGIVAENLVQQFCVEVQAPEARCFYGFQIMM